MLGRQQRKPLTHEQPAVHVLQRGHQRHVPRLQALLQQQRGNLGITRRQPMCRRLYQPGLTVLQDLQQCK